MNSNKTKQTNASTVMPVIHFGLAIIAYIVCTASDKKEIIDCFSIAVFVFLASFLISVQILFTNENK